MGSKQAEICLYKLSDAASTALLLELRNEPLAGQESVKNRNK